MLANDPDTPLVDIQTVLGHEKITTTAIYIGNMNKSTGKTTSTLDRVTEEYPCDDDTDE